MTTLTEAPLAPLLDRLFAEAAAASPQASPALADLGPDDVTRLMRSKTDYLDFYTRLKDLPLAVSRETGTLLYMLARSCGARTIVEFGTSFGLSTLYLAAALRDNGGGRLITSEFEPSKVARARENLTEGGLVDLVEIRQGDALQTLRVDLPETIDLLLLDGRQGALSRSPEPAREPPQAGRARRRRRCRPQPRLSGARALAGPLLPIDAVRRRRRAVHADVSSAYFRAYVPRNVTFMPPQLLLSSTSR